MVEDVHFTGSVYYNYIICSRKAWLMQHQIDPEQEHDLLDLGRLNQEEHYKRADKELELPGIKVDRVHREGAEFVIGEIKKSSVGQEASIMQLIYYLSCLEEKGMKARARL